MTTTTENSKPATTKKKAPKKTAALKPLTRRLVTIRILGLSPLIQHAWAEKAKEMIRAKQQHGKKTRDRELRDPEQEGRDAAYWVDEKTPGFNVVALKTAVIEAAHNDLGIPKTLVRKALFVYPPGRNSCVPIEKPDGSGLAEFTIEEDMVRVGAGTADLRYRPYYWEWSVTTQWELIPDQLLVEDFLQLVDRAGYTVGVNEWRPEKGGEFGRFRIDPKFKIRDEPLV